MLSCSFPLTQPSIPYKSMGDLHLPLILKNVVTQSSFKISLCATTGVILPNSSSRARAAGLWERGNLLFCAGTCSALPCQVQKPLAVSTGGCVPLGKKKNGSCFCKNMNFSKQWLEKNQFFSWEMGAHFIFNLNSQEPLSKTLHQPPAGGVWSLTSLLRGCQRAAVP